MKRYILRLLLIYTLISIALVGSIIFIEKREKRERNYPRKRLYVVNLTKDTISVHLTGSYTKAEKKELIDKPDRDTFPEDTITLPYLYHERAVRQAIDFYIPHKQHKDIAFPENFRLHIKHHFGDIMLTREQILELSKGNSSQNSWTLYIDSNLLSQFLEKKYETITTKHPLQLGDTIFLVNETTSTRYLGFINTPFVTRSAIYIAPNKRSEYYNKICDFRVNINESRSYFLKPSKKKELPEDLPTEWVPLHLYNGQYYLYAPCEWLINKYKITNTNLISYGSMEGDYADAYSAIVKNSENSYTIKDIHNKPCYNGSPYELTINIVNKEHGIAIFSFKGDFEEHYELMVQANKARRFPIIVHYCEMKEMPYRFETPDFKSLLKMRK